MLMTPDSFQYAISLFYRGLNPVSDEEVIAMYEGSHVPLEIMSDFYGKVMIIFSLMYENRDINANNGI